MIKKLNVLLNELSIKAGYLNHEDYLNSDHWQEFLKNHKKQFCYCCGMPPKKINFHYINYNKLGKEDQEDVIFCCSTCWAMIRRLIKKGFKNAHLIQQENVNRKRKQRERFKCLSEFYQIRKFSSLNNLNNAVNDLIFPEVIKEVIINFDGSCKENGEISWSWLIQGITPINILKNV